MFFLLVSFIEFGDKQNSAGTFHAIRKGHYQVDDLN